MCVLEFQLILLIFSDIFIKIIVNVRYFTVPKGFDTYDNKMCNYIEYINSILMKRLTV